MDNVIYPADRMANVIVDFMYYIVPNIPFIFAIFAFAWGVKFLISLFNGTHFDYDGDGNFREYKNITRGRL